MESNLSSIDHDTPMPPFEIEWNLAQYTSNTSRISSTPPYLINKTHVWINETEMITVHFVSDWNIRFINSSKGGRLIMCHGYTFYQKCRTWKVWTCCGKHKHFCGAKLKMENDAIVPINLEHNHPPPQFHITRDGRYVKI